MITTVKLFLLLHSLGVLCGRQVKQHLFHVDFWSCLCIYRLMKLVCFFQPFQNQWLASKVSILKQRDCCTCCIVILKVKTLNNDSTAVVLLIPWHGNIFDVAGEENSLVMNGFTPQNFSFVDFNIFYGASLSKWLNRYRSVGLFETPWHCIDIILMHYFPLKVHA